MLIFWTFCYWFPSLLIFKMLYTNLWKDRSNSRDLKKIFNLFSFWLCWVFVAVDGLVSSHSKPGLLFSFHAWASHCGCFSYCWAWALDVQVSVAMARRLSWSMACGMLPDQGLNPCLLYWQVDPLPLKHQGSSRAEIFTRGKHHSDSHRRGI